MVSVTVNWIMLSIDDDDYHSETSVVEAKCAPSSGL
jgi:hypothetical protein